MADYEIALETSDRKLPVITCRDRDYDALFF